MIESLGARHGVSFAIPAKEIRPRLERPRPRHRTRPAARTRTPCRTTCSRRCTSATRSASPASRAAPRSNGAAAARGGRRAMSTAAANRGTDLSALLAVGSELVARDRWPRERILAHQQQGLRRASRLRGRRLALLPGGARARTQGGTRSLSSELPVLSKETLVDQFDRIVTEPDVKLAALEAAPAQGPDPEGLYAGRFRAFSTSGTSGLRALIVYREDEFRFWVAARSGSSPGSGSRRRPDWRRSAPRARSTSRGSCSPPSARAARGRHASRCSTPLDELVAAPLNDYRPEAVVGYASIAALLAQEQLEGRLRIAPRDRRGQQRGADRRGPGWIRERLGSRPDGGLRLDEKFCISPRARRLIPACTSTKIWRSSRWSTSTDRPVPPGRPGYKVLVTNLVQPRRSR